jgi:hypothetical protein
VRHDLHHVMLEREQVSPALGVPLWLTGGARTGRLPDTLYWRIDDALK